MLKKKDKNKVALRIMREKS